MILATQSTYAGVEVGVYDRSQRVAHAYIDKKNACTDLILVIDMLLKKAACSLVDLEYIVVNRGPAPFTSLRTVITTMNGIAFSKQIPLLGLSALEVMMYEYDQENTKNVLIILNAYGKEYYYAFKKIGSVMDVGVCSHSQLPLYDGEDPLYVIGHVDTLSLEQTQQYIHPLVISDHFYTTLHGLALYGIVQFTKSASCIYHISPLYLKNHF